MANKSSSLGKGVRRKNKSASVKLQSNEVLAQVRALVWKGQHLRAIELASEELSRVDRAAGSSPGLQMDLLELRAESYISQGKLDLAAGDANTMLKLASGAKQKTKMASLRAQALHCQALVQMRAGDLKAAVKNAKAALKLARQIKQKRLIAQSLFRLSEACWRTGQGQAACEAAQEAIVLFEALGDQSGAGRAYWSLASARFKMGHAEDSRRAAQAALGLCKAAGDQYGIGNSFNALFYTDVDIADRIQHLQQATQAYEAAGHAERRVVALANLALTYLELGLYSHSHRIQTEIIEIMHTMGSKVGLTYGLSNIIEPEIILGDFEAAQEHLQELGSLVPDLGDPFMESMLAAEWGDLAFARGDFKTALRYYRPAVKHAKQAKLGPQHVFLTKLGMAHLANHDPASALKATTSATDLHRAQSFPVPEDFTSQEIWWRHAQALLANKKVKEARQALDRAYDFLLETIQKIRDVGLRRNSLNKVPVNRELIHFWLEDGLRRNLPVQRLLAYLNIESNTREPFKRLTDTSLRLNALKTVAEIQSFIVEEATELSGGERVMLIFEKNSSDPGSASFWDHPSPANHSPEAAEFFVAASLLPRGEQMSKALASIKKHLAPARLTQTVQLILPRKAGLSRVIAPLIVRNQLVGYLYTDMHSIYGRFDETDRDMLAMLANQAAVALDNAQWMQGLEKKVEERTEELQASNVNLEQRNNELAIINSLGEVMARTLDVTALVRNIGERVPKIFNAEIADIVLYDSASNMVQLAYSSSNHFFAEEPPWELGEGGLTSKAILSRQALLLNSARQMEEQGALAYITTPAGEPDPQSCLAVPIMVGERVLGVVNVQSIRPNAFDENHLRLLQTLSSNMGVALEKARLFDETQRLLRETEQRAQELAAISKVSQALVAETEVDSMIQLIGNQTREIFDADIVYVALLDLQTNLIHFPYQVGESFTTLPVGEGYTSRIIQTGESLLINEDIGERSRELGVTRRGKEALSYLGVPIKAGGETIGVISVQSTTREGLFTDDSLRLLATIAANAGAAINTARLHAETQRNASQMATIASVGRDLSATLDLQKVTRTVVENVHSLFRARDTILRLVDADGKTLRAVLALGRYAEEFSSSMLMLGEGITGSIAESGIAEVIDNVELDARKVHILGTPDREEIAETLMIAPLIANNRTIGALSVYKDRTEGKFSQVDLDFLVGLGRQAAIAIENSRLFNETQSLLKQTEQRATELQIINSIGQIITEELDLNNMVERVGDQLREALRIKNIGIGIYNEKENIMQAPYVYSNGTRLSVKPFGLNTFNRRVSKAGRSLVVNKDPQEIWLKLGGISAGNRIPKSFVMLPLLAGKELVGGISMQDFEQEDAFDKLPIGLLETIASNMGTAVQNARLFDETQRLFKDAEEARAAAEQANKAKSTFLANMSHELRTPLNAIIGFTRIVRRKAEGALPVKQLENLEKVLSSSEHLLGLINTVLDIAKIEAGRMDVIPAKFSIGALVDQCATLAVPLLKTGVKLEKQVDETVGFIFSDQDKIKQIVLNLLSNAAKFTHEGSIVLGMKRVDRETLRIAVTDSGIGISAEALGRIFEEFQQADTSTTRQYGGTGLGLAISRNLARLLGGDLTATSQLGLGSTFTLTIPVHYGKKPAPQQEEKPSPVPETALPRRDASKHRVLVIDDDPDAIYFLQEGLGNSEFEVVSAPTGYEGLQMARDQQPEAILLDILMPRTDGWQILNDLKSEAATADIPVILLTIVDKKALGFKLGAADYLLKPLDPTTVLDTLRRVIGENQNGRKCVLVVDDDPHVAEMLREILPPSEFMLMAVEDGETGLQMIKTQHPDVILLDLLMPKLDGFAVIEKLRAEREAQHIPIIVLSAKDITPDENEKLKESAAFVMKKQGFDGDRLIQEINSVIRK